jgi:2'-5' RNA ligase
VRCFVAAWPSAEVVAALAGLPRPASPRLRWSGEDQWHVTLRFFGELSPVQVDEATVVLSEVARGLPGDLTARGGPATRFLGPGLLIWPIDGLGPAAGPVGRATAHLGQPPPDRPFIGHVTIARGARGADLRQAPHLLSPLSASWPVTFLALVHSQLGAGGARYRDVCTFRLGPSQDQTAPPAGPT